MCTSWDWYPLDKVLQETGGAVQQALPCVPGAGGGDYVPGVSQDGQFCQRFEQGKENLQVR